jgi:xanthine dehydrogenase YagS FAD-binding subunit
VALDMDGTRIRQARVALGGVGTKPWRVPEVETALVGKSLDPAALRAAAALAAEGAQGHGHNDFKIELMQRADSLFTGRACSHSRDIRQAIESSELVGASS